MSLWLGAGVLALITFVVLLSLLHPDAARRQEAAAILDKLLRVLPWGGRDRQDDSPPKLPSGGES